jgi:hypothetical protein
MSATLVKSFDMFFLGMKYALKQIQSKLLTLPTKNWKCEALGCAKIVESVLPFCSTCIQALVDP